MHDFLPSFCASEHMGRLIQSEAFRTCNGLLPLGPNPPSLSRSILSFGESALLHPVLSHVYPLPYTNIPYLRAIMAVFVGHQTTNERATPYY